MRACGGGGGGGVFATALCAYKQGRRLPFLPLAKRPSSALPACCLPATCLRVWVSTNSHSAALKVDEKTREEEKCPPSFCLLMTDDCFHASISLSLRATSDDALAFHA